MAIEFRGEELLFAVAIPPETTGSDTIVRPFNQTGGTKTITADAIDLDTKDKTGSDYGKVTEEVSLEGVLSEGDPFIDFIKGAIRNKELVKIYEINTRTKEAEHGMYMISSFEKSFGNGDFATYSLSGTLNGSVTEETLVTIPTGAV
ncbi:phage major tail protein, TP901-1 family [Neobacillus sp. DY30]|uniref:phage major tail protein, TP901-1 family n=1 Tax=Neobacillus sp. DY30 TaxID=3047871 RepID=UPI0024C045B1|nr:phage major tail protein, TP901-1 family [Neobacillus sp. DY30]WHY01875.1 phage major tail protein, TP901-1 family [Neobacillus sp. DY30]